jgi:hypothetical protein
LPRGRLCGVAGVAIPESAPEDDDPPDGRADEPRGDDEPRVDPESPPEGVEPRGTAVPVDCVPDRPPPDACPPPVDARPPDAWPPDPPPPRVCCADATDGAASSHIGTSSTSARLDHADGDVRWLMT